MPYARPKTPPPRSSAPVRTNAARAVGKSVPARATGKPAAKPANKVGKAVAPRPPAKPAAKATQAANGGSGVRFERWLALSVLCVLLVLVGGTGWFYYDRTQDADRLTDAALAAYQDNVTNVLSQYPRGHLLTGPALECVREGVLAAKRRQARNLMTLGPHQVAQSRLTAAKATCMEQFLKRSEMYLANDRGDRKEMRDAIIRALGY
jgi:hypothetical protein